MADAFPPGCTCERIDIGGPSDLVGAKAIRGRSDPPCRVHLPSERALYDTAYHRGVIDAANAVGNASSAPAARRAILKLIGARRG